MIDYFRFLQLKKILFRRNINVFHIAIIHLRSVPTDILERVFN